jgi:nucleoside-diphosphate-sugar epimerase
MRVFVTGATGFIGSAVVQDLLAAGHQVLGFARSDASAATLDRLGVPVQRGDLTDLDSLRAGASACDGVIHTAFIHDFSQFAANIETDRLAVEAMCGVLKGSGKPLATASGTLMVQGHTPATEKDGPPSPTAGRAAAEVLVLNTPGVRGRVVRLPPTVHGAGDHGFMALLIAAAREHGVRPMWAMARTAGRRSIAWTPRGSSAWRSNTTGRARPCTPPARRASPSAPSPRRSEPAWASP